MANPCRRAPGHCLTGSDGSEYVIGKQRIPIVSGLLPGRIIGVDEADTVPQVLGDGSQESCGDGLTAGDAAVDSNNSRATMPGGVAAATSRQYWPRTPSMGRGQALRVAISCITPTGRVCKGATETVDERCSPAPLRGVGVESERHPHELAVAIIGGWSSKCRSPVAKRRVCTSA